MKIRKKRKDSLIPQLFFLFLAVILPLNLLCLISVSLYARNVRRESKAQKNQLLSSYMDQIDGALDAAFLNFDIISSEYDFIYLQSVDEENSEEQYQFLRSKVAISNQFKTWLTENDLISGYFFRQEDGNDGIYRASDPSEINIWRYQLGTELPISDYVTTTWKALDFDDTEYLFFLYSKRRQLLGSLDYIGGFGR